MKKVLLLAALIVVAFYSLKTYKEKNTDYKDLLYSIGGVSVHPKYFGNELHKDVDGDGREDIVFLGTNSGIYYVFVALKTDTGYKASAGTYLGADISPQ